MMKTSETPDILFTRLYLEAFPAVARYVSRRQGTLDQARDLFQEVLVVYYEKVVIGGFVPETSDKAYLFGIAKNLWLKSREWEHQTYLLQDIDAQDTIESLPATDRLLQFLRTAGERCMEILQSFYYEQLPIRDLARRFGFASERSATVQKYKCLEKIRDQVKEKSMTYEDFLV